jgi:hypothetical protein
MPRLEELVRDVLADLADEGRPVNLAAPALRRARRMRMRRAAAAVTAATAVVAALAAGLAIVGPDRSDHHPPATVVTPAPSRYPSPTPSQRTTLLGAIEPFSLPGDWILLGATTSDGTLVYDRAAGRYRQLPTYRVIPAPRGTLVAWFGPDGTPRVLDLATGVERAVAGARPHINLPGYLDWSPDGGRFVYAGRHATYAITVLVDARAATSTTIGPDFRCGGGCDPVWASADRGVAVPSPTGVDIINSSTAQRVERKPLPGALANRHAWSPDGGRLIVNGSDGRPVVFTPRTGERAPSPCAHAYGTYWVGTDQLLCVESAGYTLYRVTGEVVSRTPRPAPVEDDEVYATTLGPA